MIVSFGLGGKLRSLFAAFGLGRAKSSPNSGASYGQITARPVPFDLAALGAGYIPSALGVVIPAIASALAPISAWPLVSSIVASPVGAPIAQAIATAITAIVPTPATSSPSSGSVFSSATFIPAARS